MVMSLSLFSGFSRSLAVLVGRSPNAALVGAKTDTVPAWPGSSTGSAAFNAVARRLWSFLPMATCTTFCSGASSFTADGLTSMPGSSAEQAPVSPFPAGTAFPLYPFGGRRKPAHPQTRAPVPENGQHDAAGSALRGGFPHFSEGQTIVYDLVFEVKT